MNTDIRVEEKGDELIEKFKPFAPFQPYTDKEGTWLYKASEELKNATQCAIIAVEEIIEELDKIRKLEYTTFILRYAKFKDGTTEIEDKGESCDGYERKDFWNEVLNYLKSKL